MRLLLDTPLLIWFGYFPERLSLNARELMEDRDNELIFSVASIWEAAIKYKLGRQDFQSARTEHSRKEFLHNGIRELPVMGEHVEAASGLQPTHKDPFDRILIAQATVEGIVLLTSDAVVAGYPGPIRLV